MKQHPQQKNSIEFEIIQNSCSFFSSIQDKNLKFRHSKTNRHVRCAMAGMAIFEMRTETRIEEKTTEK